MTARLVIAAPRSGEGKTTLALGLIRALRERGLRVAACKVGPDYLDTGWHALSAGGAARNLDVWMMGEAGVRVAFEAAERDADIVVIEGVMGLFDGHRTDPDTTSTAGVARLLDAPVLLALDASHSASTLAAVAFGLSRFSESVRVAGAVLNRFRVGRDRVAVERAFARAGVAVLGWVPTDTRAEIASRHLGLTQAEEAASAEGRLEGIAALIAESVDLDAVLAMAEAGAERRDWPSNGARPGERASAGDRAAGCSDAASPVIAIARDEAFAFYYPDNLEALEGAGARLVEFSPLRDSGLPPDTAGVYLGGGYPELHAASLAANSPMLASVRSAAEGGVPIYAECGGMLYLLESLTDVSGLTHALAAVLPASARMSPTLQRVGYVEAELAADGILGSAGTRVRGHEFRYSACEPSAGDDPAWVVDGDPRGFVRGSVHASYLHLNFAGCPEVAEAFVEACRSHAATSAGNSLNGEAHE